MVPLRVAPIYVLQPQHHQTPHHLQPAQPLRPVPILLAKHVYIPDQNLKPATTERTMTATGFLIVLIMIVRGIVSVL